MFVYIFCTVLMCLAFIFFPSIFFFCVPRNMAGYFVSISSFLFGAPPRTSPFLPKIRPRMGDFQTFFPCLVSTVFGRGRGWWWIPPHPVYIGHLLYMETTPGLFFGFLIPGGGQGLCANG